jgi:large subunit ribosomal protein L29
MTSEQIRELSDEELVSQENDMAERIFRLRLQMALGQTEGTHKLQGLKKDVARIKTIRRERQLQQKRVSG